MKFPTAGNPFAPAPESLLHAVIFGAQDEPTPRADTFVTPELFLEVVARGLMLPEGYRVVGVDMSGPGLIRVTLVSEDLPENAREVSLVYKRDDRLGPYLKAVQPVRTPEELAKQDMAALQALAAELNAKGELFL